MATTTTTTTTSTRTTAAQQQPILSPRGVNIDSIYRPYVPQPGTSTSFAMPRVAPAQLPSTNPPATTHNEPQPGHAPFYTDPQFLHLMQTMMTAAANQAIDNRIPPQLPPSISPINGRVNGTQLRTSTPDSTGSVDQTSASRRNVPHTDLTQHFANLQTQDAPRSSRPPYNPPRAPQQAPAYIPAAEQALEIHQNAANAAQSNADVFSGVAEALQLISRAIPNAPPEMDHIVQALSLKAIQSSKEAILKNEGLQKARRVTKYYETPIMKPAYPIPTRRFDPRVNYKELLMLTGYFDPNDKNHDFKHTWQKLLDYGSLNEFQENQYMQALGSILKNEAYETFIEFKATNKPLEEILDYFAGVYTKKRSLVADRKAVDEFTRKKGETIIVCMERAILAIDKLKHLHDPTGWSALRQQMRHNILMQVVKEETKRAVQMEVDHVYEDTGMPYDFEKLIRFTDRYERNHNAAPKDDVTTLFKVASGGIHKKEKRSNSQDQLAHLKKEQMLQKKLSSLETELTQLKANEARLYKNDGRSDRSRESRRTDRESRSRDNRSRSYDRNRDLKTAPETGKPSTPSQSRSQSANSAQPKAPYKPPDPYKSREQSRSPYRRGQTPSDYRDRSRSRDRPRPSTQYGNRSRSNSRYTSSNPRYQSATSAPQSRSTSKDTERIMSTGSKTVIITINGQDYVPLKKEN